MHAIIERGSKQHKVVPGEILQVEKLNAKESDTRIMYAVIETGGKQYKVVPGEILQVEKLNAKEGDSIEFKALLAASGEENQTGLSMNAKVVAQVLKHIKGKKIIVFKKRPKKAYEKTSGHRQNLTEIQIKDIQLS
jgi:large subunit ribosomal protein L21